MSEATNDQIETVQISEPAKKERLPVGKFLAWQSRSISVAAVTIVTGYLTFFCTDTLGMPGTLVGTLILISKIFDGITDLFAAYIIENTNTRWGKARPYEICIFGIWGCTLLLFSASPSWGMVAKAAWVFIMYTLIFSVFTTLIGAANTPYMIRAFRNRQEIAKVASYGGILTTVGAMIVSITFPIVMSRLVTSNGGWISLVAIYSIPLAILGFMRFVFVKEEFNIPIQSTEKVKLKEIIEMLKSNKYAWLLAGVMAFFNFVVNMNVQVYYYTWVVGNLALLGIVQIISIAMLLGMIVMPQLTKRFATPNIIFGGCLIGALGYVVLFFAGSNVPLLMIGSLLSGIATFPISYLQILVIMDIAAFNESQGFQRLETSVTAVSGFTAKVFAGVGAGAIGILLSFAGYDGSATIQSDSAILMIRLMFSIIPAIGMLFSGFMALKLIPLQNKIKNLEK